MRYINVKTMEYPLHIGDLTVQYGNENEWPDFIQILHMEENTNTDENIMAEYSAPIYKEEKWIQEIKFRPLTEKEIHQKKISEENMKKFLNLAKSGTLGLTAEEAAAIAG